MAVKRGSIRYQGLVRRVRELRKHFLGYLGEPPASKIGYSALELDHARAFVVLAHAEIEAFCEDIASSKAKKATAAFDKNGTIRPVLRKIATYHAAKSGRSWQVIEAPTPSSVKSADQSYSETVKKNHGVKAANLQKLFFPLGIRESELDATWLMQMDLFGENRGGWAHTSVKTQQPPDPLSQWKDVNFLLGGLKDLDERVSKL